MRKIIKDDLRQDINQVSMERAKTNNQMSLLEAEREVLQQNKDKLLLDKD
jgi:hypothetical protein